MNSNSHNRNVLIEKLDEFTRKYYKNQLLRGVIYTAGIFFGFYLAVALLEYYGHFDTVIRTILFYSFLFSNSCIIGKLVVIPVLKLNKMGTLISYEHASEIIGNHFSEVEDKLLNVLQLQKISQFQSPNPELIEASINQKIKELKPVPFASAIDLSRNKKYLTYALIPLLLFVFILFSAPSIIPDATKRLVNHGTYFEKEAPFQFNILNKDLRLPFLWGRLLQQKFKK